MDNKENENNDELSMENEILKMKMKLQFGDSMMMGMGENVPLEIENMFLKNIMSFEEMHSKPMDKITIFEKIGKPVHKNLVDLKPNEINKALNDMIDIMRAHDINLDTLDGPYDDSVIYQFITEELFSHEIEKESIPGMSCNFIYEEFHPNNKAEIERQAHEFLKHWFLQDFNEYSSEVASELVGPNGKPIRRETVFDKLKLFFNAYSKFQNDGYNIYEIDFKEFEDGNAMGHAEGTLKYEAVLENGEIVEFKGPYKLYMSREYNYWSIVYFIMPGYRW